MILEANNNSVENLSDASILRELGKSLKQLRLKRDLTQEEVALRAGLDRTTVVQLEKGRSATLLTFVQILRVLDRLDFLNGLHAAEEISPLEVAKAMEKTRKRASAGAKQKSRKAKRPSW
ncbi:MAG: helix-turn-helix domain-containing protein [Fibrobacterota bacterium]|nr:helix-turn-helix domain-containing protein [Fibrobacterota bacterium]